MNEFFRHISIFTLILIMGCSKKSPAVNIYDSEEYKSLDRKDLIVGESIWSTACFRCHMYGTNGAVLLDDKAYWDKAASNTTAATRRKQCPWPRRLTLASKVI